MFRMPSYRHVEFDIVGDVTACVLGPIGIVDRDRDSYFVGFECVPLDEASVDSTARAAAIEESFHG